MKSYQVVGIGNAIVDVFSSADDSFLDLMGIQKGIMQLVERCGGELIVRGDADRLVQLDVLFREPTRATPAVSAWRGTAVA